MKKLIFIPLILFNLNTVADDLKTTVLEQMKFFQDNSYSCTFAVPDPLDATNVVNAYVPMHQIHFDCINDPVLNEARVNTDDRVSTGDSVLFSATMYRAGLTQFGDNVRNSLHADKVDDKVDMEDGRPYRSPILKPTEHYLGDSDNTFSMDHTLGILLYLETTYRNIQNDPTQLQNLQAYARQFTKYVWNNRTALGYQVCPVRANNVTICSMTPFIGEIQLIQDVYNYIGVTDSPFPNKAEKIADVDTLLTMETAACAVKPGYLCNLASTIYLIEKDIKFSEKRNPYLKNNMEGSREIMVKLSSNNPFQTYALSLEESAPIHWQDLGQETVDICKNFTNHEWIAADNRPDWLWEQKNHFLLLNTDPQKLIINNKKAWGWDCLAMLNLVNSNL